MRAPLVVFAALVLACSAPIALGGIVLTAVVATLAAAHAPVARAACSITDTAVPMHSPLAQAIDSWIADEVPASPLTAIGPALVAGAAGSGLDPRLLAAIAMQETRLGTLGGGPAVDNPFGLGPGLAFPNWQAAIALAVGTLQAMHAGGATTIAEIGAHWAPIGAANDPAGLNANWVGGVAAAYAQLGGDPSGPVFGRAASGTSPPPVDAAHCGSGEKRYPTSPST